MLKRGDSNFMMWIVYMILAIALGVAAYIFLTTKIFGLLT